MRIWKTIGNLEYNRSTSRLNSTKRPNLINVMVAWGEHIIPSLSLCSSLNERKVYFVLYNRGLCKYWLWWWKLGDVFGKTNQSFTFSFVRHSWKHVFLGIKDININLYISFCFLVLFISNLWPMLLKTKTI